MTIPAGQTQVSQQVLILQDDEAEGSEQFQAQLTIPSASADQGVAVGDNGTARAVITILDDDGVLVEFSPTWYTVSEGDGVVTLTLTADSVADCNYTVEVRTQDGTATGQILTQTVLRVCKLLCFCHIYTSHALTFSFGSVVEYVMDNWLLRLRRYYWLVGDKVGS